MTLNTIERKPSIKVDTTSQNEYGSTIDKAEVDDEELQLEQDTLAPLQTEQYDIPETKGLLPPLPDEQPSSSKPTHGLNNFEFEQPIFLNDSLTSPKAVQRTKSTRSVFATPTQDLVSKFESASELSTPIPRSIYSFESQKPSLDTSLLNYSPTIAIQERFEVSIDIQIDSDVKSPKTTEGRIKLYQDIQKKELLEFNKTLEELSSSGWMTEAQLRELEISKTKNFEAWEQKIQSLKNTLEISLSSLSLGPSPLGSSQQPKSNLKKKSSFTSLLASPAFSNNSQPVSNNDDYFTQTDEVVSTHEKIKRKLSFMGIR